MVLGRRPSLIRDGGDRLHREAGLVGAFAMTWIDFRVDPRVDAQSRASDGSYAASLCR
jgi:hypothetical protein